MDNKEKNILSFKKYLTIKHILCILYTLNMSTIQKRIRIRSPLREYISQAYAISIMRVALPEEIPIERTPGVG